MDQNSFARPYSFMPNFSLPEKWKPLKAIVSRLYVDENRKLEEVMDVVRKQYGFDARSGRQKTLLFPLLSPSYIRAKQGPS